ncbi:MAG: sigma-70 family RNA polymerase sigma factor [Phycisphaerales bacterium]
MAQEHTTAAVQRYLLELADGSPTEPVVRALLERAVDRLHMLCTSMLLRGYPRLARPPHNLQSDEMLSAVIERLIKAMREVRPETTRQFFALATRHMRWELNDLARRLDERGAGAVELREQFVSAPESSGSVLSPNARRMFAAIDALPEEEREVFDLVRIQGLAQTEAAEILGVATKTVQRRLNRALMLLAEELKDLRPATPRPTDTRPRPDDRRTTHPARARRAQRVGPHARTGLRR